MEYTKGPWRAEGRLIIGLKEKPICEVPQHGIKRHKTDDGNAHLIAAAPDMYEALKAIEEWYGQGKELCTNDPPFKIMLQALSKAEGRPD